MSKRIKTIIAVTILIIVAIVITIIPTSYYIESPGTAVTIEPIMSIEGVENDTNGEYMLTTVQSMRGTPLMLFLSLFDDYSDIYSEEEMIGDIENYDTFLNIQQYMMDSSKQTAVEAAYNLAGYPVEREYLGVYVSQVIPESNFYGQLQPGDVVTTVNGEQFETAQDFIDKVSSLEVGESIDITYLRDDMAHTASGELILVESTGLPGIGIGVTDYSTIAMDPEVEIDTGAIGGPSAGFMFSLQIYTLLVDQDLPAGKSIAGTGTIDSEGNVGRIGGIHKKVVAADNEGAEIFFAPDDEITDEMREYDPEIQTNYEEAKAAADDIGTQMEIVPVKTLEDAINYLKSINTAQETENNLSLFSCNYNLDYVS